MIITLRISLFFAAISANIAMVAVNIGTDVWTHVDVWAPAVNTALLIYLYRMGRKVNKKQDEARKVAREGMEELKQMAEEGIPDGNGSPESE